MAESVPPAPETVQLIVAVEPVRVAVRVMAAPPTVAVWLDGETPSITVSVGGTHADKMSAKASENKVLKVLFLFINVSFLNEIWVADGLPTFYLLRVFHISLPPKIPPTGVFVSSQA